MVTLLRNFDRSRFRLSLAVVDMKGAVFTDDVPADVELIDLKSQRVRNALPRIVKLIWRRRPHLVFSTLGHLNVAIAMLRALLPNDVRYIAREATIVSQLRAPYAMPRWWFWLYRRCYSRFDAIVCQSAEMRRDLVEHFAVPQAKTIVIYNPIDIERIQRLSAEPAEADAPEAAAAEVRLVAAGSLTHVKGFDLLLEALALDQHKRFHLTILGDGPLLGPLTELVEKRDLSARVRFAGFRKNPYVYFRQADAFVLSSRFEGFPNVVLESLACGVPVIAVPCPGGVREIFDDMEGCLLADDCSSGALFSAISGFVYGRGISAQVLKRYAVAHIVSCYEELFLDIVAARRTAPGGRDVTQHKQEVAAGERFEFGANWSRFLRLLDAGRISQAEDSLRKMLGVADLSGKRFLDAGSGSGLFSLAARRLGATVHSFDYDPHSVGCTEELRRRYFPGDRQWTVESGSVLDSDYLARLGQFDVVYSWGVLHHTGNQRAALENVVQMVAPQGQLFIALYNDQGWISAYWTAVKRYYNRNSTFRISLTLAHVPYLLVGRFVARALTGRLREERGMSLWYDMVDWLGGWPFEVSKPDDVVEFYSSRGFAVRRLITVGKRLGCNEFVFSRSAGS